jgi:hypothetical protein
MVFAEPVIHWVLRSLLASSTAQAWPARPLTLSMVAVQLGLNHVRTTCACAGRQGWRREQR